MPVVLAAALSHSCCRTEHYRLVPVEGIEPPLLAEHDFESCASTSSATRASADTYIQAGRSRQNENGCLASTPKMGKLRWLIEGFRGLHARDFGCEANHERSVSRRSGSGRADGLRHRAGHAPGRLVLPIR